MKLPKMKKLPSGSWRMQIQLEGERFSITDKDPKVVKQKAREIIGGEKPEKVLPVTVGEAIDSYIASKPRLSPSTIYGYEKIRKHQFQSLANINLYRLTQADIDRAIEKDIKAGYGPKSIRNAHGLLTATLRKYRPKLHVDSCLPDPAPSVPVIPTEEELRKIWAEAMKGDKYILTAILLSSWLGLRMSEIIALKYSDLDGDHVNISRARVPGKNGEMEKGPKSKAGYRRIKLPTELVNIISELPHNSDDEYIIKYHRTTIMKKFHQISDAAGAPRCRMHDLRHFSASEALSLNIPDKYQMKRMGHSTDIMLKTVYQHVMRDKEDYFSNIMDSHLSVLYQSAHADAHEKIKEL